MPSDSLGERIIKGVKRLGSYMSWKEEEYKERKPFELGAFGLAMIAGSLMGDFMPNKKI